MKKTALWATLAVLAGSLVSCAQQEEEALLPVREQGTRVHFKAAPLQTKTAFAEPSVEDGIATYPTLWTENDTQVAISLNFADAVNGAVQPSDDLTQATFDADFADADATAPYTFYVLSPASALQAVSPSRKALTVSVPSVQTPLAQSPDEAAQILVAQSEASDEMPEDVDVHFAHLTGYGRLTLKNIPEGEEVTSVVLTSPDQPWSGTWYYNTADGTVEAKEASASITVKTDASADVWFACAPVDMKGKTLKIAVKTATGSYEREITLSGKNVDFSAGHVYKFSVNMESATFVENQKEVYYELVTDASSLKAGDEVIIANVPDTKIPAYYAISTTQKTNNRSAVEVTVEDDKIYDPDPETVEIFSVEAGSSNGTWSFKTHDGKYIACGTGNKSNQLLSNTGNNGYSSWNVSISGGAATLKASQGSRSYMLYNHSNTLFSCYNATTVNGTTTSLVALYRKTEGETVPGSDDPILEQDVFGAYLESGNILYTQGSQQLSREYTGSTVTFAILDKAQNSVFEFAGIPAAATVGDTFTLTFNQLRGNKIISSQEYNVTVAGEEGAKLRLSDGAGNGFIVKR